MKSSIGIGWVFFLKAGYIIGVGFKILTRRPVPKSPPPPSLKLVTLCLCKLCAIVLFATSCPNYAQWMTRYHLELLYSDEAHPTACAMLDTGAMIIRRTNKPFFRTPVDLNLEQIMSMLMFHPD